MKRRLKTHDKAQERNVRPTAHRLAGWLSIAPGLAGVPHGRVRFPPEPDDVAALETAWKYRVDELFDAGTKALGKFFAYGMAQQCKPHAFAYAGEGKPCRLSLCPFCNALEAALTYERVRRALGGRDEVGLVLGQLSLKVLLDDLDDPFGTVSEANVMLRDDFVADAATGGGHLGAIVKFSAWPHETFDRYAVLSARVLAAVPAKSVRKIASAYRQGRRSEYPWDKVYAVSRSPVPLARAVAHLCRYPETLLTAPPERVADVLNRLRGKQLSRVRGLFRSSLTIDPARFPFQAVPRVRGVGVVGETLSLLPAAEEAPAAREFARTLGLPVADTFAALSRAAGVPLHWLGRVPISVNDLARPSKRSALYAAVSQHRPRRPAEHHALVCVSPGVGLQLLSTWTPHPGDVVSMPGIATGLQLKVCGRSYTVGAVRDFGRRALQEMTTLVADRGRWG